MNASFELIPEAVGTAAAESKMIALDRLAQLFAGAYGLSPELVHEGLAEREKLGSTGFGRSVAIPHARYEGLKRPVAALLRLEGPVDFEAADAVPVDLVFGLLSPPSCGAAHLHALAAISRLVRNEDTHRALLDAPRGEALYALLSNVSERDVA